MLTLVPDRLSMNVERLVIGWNKEKTALIAPTLLAFEVTASLRRWVYTNALTPTEGKEALDKFLGMPIHISTRRSIFPLALELARNLNRPRAYDTAYLALAQLIGCEFWTADERLYNAVKDKLAWVKWVK